MSERWEFTLVFERNERQWPARTCLTEEKTVSEHMQSQETVGTPRASLEGAPEIFSDHDIWHSRESNQTFRRPPGKGNKQWRLWDLRDTRQRPSECELRELWAVISKGGPVLGVNASHLPENWVPWIKDNIFCSTKYFEYFLLLLLKAILKSLCHLSPAIFTRWEPTLLASEITYQYWNTI